MTDEHELHAAHLRHVIAQIPAVLWSVDEQLRFTSSTGAGLAALGLQPGQVVGMPLAEYFQQPDLAGEPLATCRRALAGASVTFDFEWNGRVWRSRVDPLRDSAGAIVGAIGLSVDVTEQHLAERALLRERERLAITLRSIGDGVIAVDTELRVALMNPSAEALTGWLEAEAVGRPIDEVFRVVDAAGGAFARSPIAEAVASRHATRMSSGTRLVARCGVERLVSDSCTPIIDADGALLGAVLVFRDITAQARMDEELQRAQRLESLGVLAGGIAHDFNNMLTTILASVSLARRRAKGDADLLSLLAAVEAACGQATGLTRQLLTFSQGGAPVRVYCRLDELVASTAEFVLRGSASRAEVRIAPGLWPAHVDQHQISQVVANLLLNAVESMPAGSVVRVRADNRTITGGEPVKLPLAPGPYVVLEVADAGVGIPEAELARVFDPYFSSKQRGSGLGLTTAYSIVHKHDGHIAVASRMGEGTVVTVYVPAVPEAEVAEEPARAVRGRGAGARVLVMDDERPIRAVAELVLRGDGYRVDTVAGGAQAIEQVRAALEAGDPFAVAILDLTIPGGMGGADTAGELRALDPSLALIASSGYATDPVLAEFGAHGFDAMLAKPYSADELSAAVARARKCP